MSQQNVEIVRTVYEAFRRRDRVTPFKFYAPDIEWDVTGVALAGEGVYHGHAGVQASFQDVLEAFRDFEFRPLELRAVGGCVLVTVHEHGVGRESGVVVDRRHYAVWTLREGMITRMHAYLDRAEALEALAK